LYAQLDSLFIFLFLKFVFIWYSFDITGWWHIVW